MAHRPAPSRNCSQCSSDCAPSVEAIPRQAVSAPAALVASPAADHIQVVSSEVQGSQHVHSMQFTCTVESRNLVCHRTHLTSRCLYLQHCNVAYCAISELLYIQRFLTNSKARLHVNQMSELHHLKSSQRLFKLSLYTLYTKTP